MKERAGKNSAGPERTRKVIIKPASKRQVRRFLKEPLSRTSAVIYFTEKDRRPFLLGPDGGGISAGGEFRLTKKWRLTKDKLDRIFIIAAEKDAAEVAPEDGDPPEGEE